MSALIKRILFRRLFKKTGFRQFICLWLLLTSLIGCEQLGAYTTPAPTVEEARLVPTIYHQNDQLDGSSSEPVGLETREPNAADTLPVPMGEINPLAPGINGNYIFVPAGKRLTVLDISDPANLKEVGHRILGGRIGTLMVDDQYAYATRGVPGLYISILEILDIRDVTNPISIYSFSPGSDISLYSSFSDVVVNGHYAYTVRGNRGTYWLKKYNLSNPAQPVAENDILYLEGSGSLTVSDNYIYLSQSRADRFDITLSSFMILDSGDLHRIVEYNLLREKETARLPRFRYSLVAQFDNQIYFTDFNKQPFSLRIFNMEDPLNPVETANFPNWDYSISILTSTIGYTLNDVFQLYDLSSPPDVVKVGSFSFPTPRHSRILGIKDNLVYFLLSNEISNEVSVLDISDKMNPREIGNYTIDAD